ncbi:MAG: tetratricopeptide repeat protein [Candidatus Aminicenantales bacterium]
MIKKIVFAAVLAVLTLGAGLAQTTGKIEGRVTDPAGNPLEKVAVSIVSQRTSSIHYELSTDKKGKFLQVGITPGGYLVIFKKEGFAPVSKEVRVSIDETTQVDTELKTVEAAIQKTLSEADGLFLKGNKLYADQKYAEASAAYREAVKLDPANWRYYMNLGLACKKMGGADEALAAFRKALELNPESFSANKEIGETLGRAGKLDEAKPYYEKAVGLRPDDPDAHYNLGLCLRSTGEPDAAQAQFQRAVELKPDFADPYYELGTLLIGQNKVPEAVASLEKFLALAPDHPNAGAAKQLLQALKK